jgi:hypothetical protein
MLSQLMYELSAAKTALIQVEAESAAAYDNYGETEGTCLEHDALRRLCPSAMDGCTSCRSLFAVFGTKYLTSKSWNATRFISLDP